MKNDAIPWIEQSKLYLTPTTLCIMCTNPSTNVLRGQGLHVGCLGDCEFCIMKSISSQSQSDRLLFHAGFNPS